MCHLYRCHCFPERKTFQILFILFPLPTTVCLQTTSFYGSLLKLPFFTHWVAFTAYQIRAGQLFWFVLTLVPPFNTVDHSVLLNRLQRLVFLISSIAFSWTYSRIKGCSQCVHGGHLPVLI